MKLKKILFLLIMSSTIFNLHSSNNNSSKEREFKEYIEKQQQYIEKQQQALKEQKERGEKIIEILSLSLRLQAEKMQNDLEKEAARKAALEKEANKGFSFNECGIVIRDTFLEEFNLRNFSIEFCEGSIKYFKRLILNKAIQESFNGVDYVFGTALTRHVHPQAGIYPITFLQSNSFGEYQRQRKSLIEQENAAVKELHNQADDLLTKAGLTTALLKAQERLEATQKVLERENPEVIELRKNNDKLLKEHGINPELVKEEERQKAIIKLIAQEHPLVKLEAAIQNDKLLDSGYLIAIQAAQNDTFNLNEMARNAQSQSKQRKTTDNKVEIIITENNSKEATPENNTKPSVNAID